MQPYDVNVLGPKTFIPPVSVWPEYSKDHRKLWPGTYPWLSLAPLSCLTELTEFMASCSVLGCSSSQKRKKNNDDIIFHHFPKDKLVLVKREIQGLSLLVFFFFFLLYYHIFSFSAGPIEDPIFFVNESEIQLRLASVCLWTKYQSKPLLTLLSCQLIRNQIIFLVN